MNIMNYESSTNSPRRVITYTTLDSKEEVNPIMFEHFLADNIQILEEIMHAVLRFVEMLECQWDDLLKVYNLPTYLLNIEHFHAIVPKLTLVIVLILLFCTTNTLVYNSATIWLSTLFILLLCLLLCSFTLHRGTPCYLR